MTTTALVTQGSANRSVASRASLPAKAPGELPVLQNGLGIPHVTFRVANQLFGIPCDTVLDVQVMRSLTRVPLASREVRGLMNLRGRIVPAIDIGLLLGVRGEPVGADSLCMTIECGPDLYCLLVDDVSEVISLEAGRLRNNLPTMGAELSRISNGLYWLDEGLLILTSSERLIDQIERHREALLVSGGMTALTHH